MMIGIGCLFHLRRKTNERILWHIPYSVWYTSIHSDRGTNVFPLLGGGGIACVEGQIDCLHFWRNISSWKKT